MSSDADRIKDVLTLPALDRERTPRQPLTDKGLVRFVLLCGALSLIVVGSLAVYFFVAHSATVPSLIGLSSKRAETEVDRQGLHLRIDDRLYSRQPQGVVLSQQPRPGTRLRRGSAVVLTVSGGTGDVTIPSLKGLTQGAALKKLNNLGLNVSVVSEISREKPGTVVGNSPESGIKLKVGETIVLHIASSSASITLVDYSLKGKDVVIEPHYSARYPKGDITYDVSQRLASLIEAADGTPHITRMSTETTVSAAKYSERAAKINPDATLVLELDGTKTEGLAVLAEKKDDSLGQTLFTQLKRVSNTAIFLNNPVPSASEPIYSALCSLGSSTSKTDQSLLSDSLYCDSIARALYLSLGKVLDD